MTFGEKIKICRKAFDITQEQLADRLQTTKQVVSRYESGQRVPKLTAALDYAKALNIPYPLLIDPSVPFCIWEDYSYLEDYEHGDDSVRRTIVERLGLDPRVAADYGSITDPSPSAESIYKNLPTQEGEEVWKAICADRTKLSLAAWIAELKEDDLRKVAQVLAAILGKELPPVDPG